ncbi:hypothetical protein QO206_02510 [Leeuwenhoekiella aequorea]|uniref:hypothetical protein n=1 Tax=Leeuwenhoekiella TaxID=283735 RepID=UPI000691E410|nr:hypothetical protein [Leeuwenhoekiella sp. MAR_2009_132]|tara:strand:- start:8821 stop:9489 length:669 start_codon:yes stop_codon:yes gene_type:complete
MSEVNYITQLNTVFDRFSNDSRIKQGHITLYLAFFQKWNRSRFKKYIEVSRLQIMDCAKIKSKTTYHNYLKDLNDWRYLNYYPTYNPARGSKIEMFIFWPVQVQKLDLTVPEVRQNLTSFNKQKTIYKYINKQGRPKNELVVLNYFEEQKWPADEGKKFYAYYQSKNWKLSKGLKIQNWQKLALNFVENGFKNRENYTSPFSGFVEDLKVKSNRIKNYDEPL